MKRSYPSNDAEEYTRRFLESILRGIADAEAGRFFSTGEVTALLAKARQNRDTNPKR